MTEADLRVQLSLQTVRPVELVDVLMLDGGHDAAAEQLSQVATSAEGGIVLFDTLTDKHLAIIGSLICNFQQTEAKPLFVAGSSGMADALTRHWQAAGIASRRSNDSHTKPGQRSIRPVERTLVVSGSCSPVTDRQINWALANGFAEVPLDTPRLLQVPPTGADLDDIVTRIKTQLDAGRSVIAHTSRGPSDPRLVAPQYSASVGTTPAEQLGVILGRILRAVLRSNRLSRVGVTGGDTSGYVARTLGIDALEMVAPLTPGAPLCVARSGDADVDGLEITFKGGQVGHDDFFGILVEGRQNR